MALPLVGIEAIIAYEDLKIASEDAVYELVLEWARARFPELKERREILGSQLARHIRFPYMTCRKLKKVLTCDDFDREIATKLVLEALFFKAEAPHRQRVLASANSAAKNHQFVERAYKYRPVKVVEFELPKEQCIVYLDLKRDECEQLHPSGRVYSQAFHLGGQGFFLSAHCNMDQQSSFHCFGLFLGMQEKGSVTFAVDYEFAARSKPTKEFVSKYKGNYTFTGGKAVGYRNLFQLSWTDFMAEDSPYFINGVLHLRAELTIKNGTSKANVIATSSPSPARDLSAAPPLSPSARFPEEAMTLPLEEIEAILASDDLQIVSEDAVYDFVLEWARAQFPILEDRREILGSRLARHIRFPYMRCLKLKKVLTCNDFDHELATKLVLEALFFKAEAPHRQRALASEDSAATNRHFIERAYKYRPVKVVEFELPKPQCVVYLDLKRDECEQLHPSGRAYSQAFYMGGQGFFLSAHCNMEHPSNFHCFGFFLGMQEKGSVTFGVDYEFAARSKPSEEFVSKYKGNYTFTGGKAVGYRNLFQLPWTDFMAEDSPYFINGILHLRAELKMTH